MSFRLDWLKTKESQYDINLWRDKYFFGFDSSVIKSARKIMDYGCGVGYYLIPLSQQEEYEVIGVEKDLDIIGYLESIGQKNVINLTRFEEIVKNESMKFDLILLIDVLHNYYFSMTDRALLILKLKKCLYEHGRIVVTFNHISENERERICYIFHMLGFQLYEKTKLKVIHDGLLKFETFYFFSLESNTKQTDNFFPFLFSNVKDDILKKLAYSLHTNSFIDMEKYVENISEQYKKIYLENFFQILVDSKKFEKIFLLLREPFEIKYKNDEFGAEIISVNNRLKEQNKRFGDIFFWKDSLLEIIISSKDDTIKIHYISFK
ncbi:class I SAM-dependent methyltransferase [Parasphaerochaeta coccoides]|uniref:Methyltransferase type 12 n=1 Tax=Parasphaerochaeta coccoides (strain ATCC BAA-1237 / DSM 17374 / SPN1) TaxID=760011 RepID=F4GID5_PARC1|nr:class I SAM-dependent methyltransferase [Parasphaerochaeta coccoides]AEC01643.1 Methyltransferase type 12 [Parasphaerochaeta coccoides DSM 17374]